MKLKREPLNNINFVEKDYTNNTAYIIHINRKKEEHKVIIDLEDVDKIKKFTWRYFNGYFITGNRVTSNMILLHRFLFMPDLLDTVIIDHINSDGLDNRKINLRKTTQLRNVGNRNINNSKRNKSGFIGVSYNKKRKKFEPEIKFNYQKVHLCRYSLLEEAVYARFLAEVLLFKKYRNKNNNSNFHKQISKISLNRKKEIKKYIIDKIFNKFDFKEKYNYYSEK